MFTLKSRILVISSINKTADSSWQLLLLTRIRGCHSAAALCFHYFFLCLLDGVRFTLCVFAFFDSCCGIDSEKDSNAIVFYVENQL